MLRAKGNVDKSDNQHEGQHKQAKHDQSAHEQFQSPPGIFQGLAIDVNTAPDMLSHIGFGPEPVNCERHKVQQKVDDGESPQSGARNVFDDEYVPLRFRENLP